MINPMDMTGRLVLVTGASSGIGKETSICLSKLGARVILVSRKDESLVKTLSIMDANEHFVAPFDLTNLGDIPGWMKQLAKEHGPLDGVVHCAGISKAIPIRAWTEQQSDHLFKINLGACFALAKGFRQKNIHKVPGSLVFISSVAGLTGEPGLAAYTASKAAIIGLTRSLAIELLRDGIRVNNVAPGWVQTDMTDRGLEEERMPGFLSEITVRHPMGLGVPRDVANAIIFLLAESGRWITGTTLIVDGGFTINS